MSGFVPVRLDQFVVQYLRNNKDADGDTVRAAVEDALAAWRQGVRCVCGKPLWVARTHFAPSAGPKPVPRTWLDPPGQRLFSSKVELRGWILIKLLDAPGGAELTTIEGRWPRSAPLRLRRLGRRGPWSKLWYRPSKSSALAFIGWARTQDLRVRRRAPNTEDALGVLIGHTGRDSAGLLGLAGGGDRRSKVRVRFFKTRRDLPLYLRANPRARSVGVLRQGKTEWRGKLPRVLTARGAQFFTIQLHRRTLFVPFSQRFFTSFYRWVKK